MFLKGGNWGRRGKSTKNAGCLGKRHDNKILKVQVLLSRDYVVIAQAPILDRVLDRNGTLNCRGPPRVRLAPSFSGFIKCDPKGYPRKGYPWIGHLSLFLELLWQQFLREFVRRHPNCGYPFCGNPFEGELKVTDLRWQREPKPQIFADSHFSWRFKHLEGTGKPKKFRPKIFEENRRKLRRLGSITFGPSPLARPYLLVLAEKLLGSVHGQGISQICTHSSERDVGHARRNFKALDAVWNHQPATDSKLRLDSNYPDVSCDLWNSCRSCLQAMWLRFEIILSAICNFKSHDSVAIWNRRLCFLAICAHKPLRWAF